LTKKVLGDRWNDFICKNSSLTSPNTKTAIVQKIFKTNCPETLSLKKPILLGLPRLILQANKTVLTFFVTPASLTLLKHSKLRVSKSVPMDQWKLSEKRCTNDTAERVFTLIVNTQTNIFF
jgi:hypothetical protein